MPKQIFIMKIDNVRGTEATEGVKNYAGIYPYAYCDKAVAIAKATELGNLDVAKHGKAVRAFEIVSCNVGDKAWAKLVAAKAANKKADVPVFILRLASDGEAVDNVPLYGGVYPWAYADADTTNDKVDALANEGHARDIFGYELKGLSGLAAFVPTRPAPVVSAPVRPLSPAPVVRPATCSCGSCRTATGTLNGTTSDGATLRGTFAAIVEGGE